MAALALCSERGRFLFEARPDLFPEGYLTPCETQLWARWYKDRAEAQDLQRRRSGH
jgi:hypothetical protein